jgi:hypothetical protein
MSVPLSFPIWFLAQDEIKIANLARVEPAGRKIVLLFTDELKAKEFKNANATFSSYMPRMLPDPVAAFGLAVLLERKGFTDAIFDPGPAPRDPNSLPIQPVPLYDLRAYLEKIVS